MNDREVKRFEMINRVDIFGRDYATDFAPGSKAAALFAGLKTVIVDVKAARTGQQSGRATVREVLFDSLRLDLKNIVRTAREIADEKPGFGDQFRMPASSSQTALLTAADKMVIELKKPGVAEEFIAYELPATFVADLEEDLAALDTTRETKDSANTKGVENTAALGLALKRGLRIVDKLHAIMNNKYARQPEKLRAWESARHTDRVAQREKASPPAPTQAPTTTASA